MARITCGTCGGVLGSRETFATASLFLSPAEYFGTTYTPPAAVHSSYVYVPDEPIAIDIRIANVGGTPVVLKTTAGNASEAFRATRLDGGPLQVRFENDVVLLRRDSRLSTNWGDFGMLPGESLLFKTTITGPALAPGEYILEVETAFTDGDGSNVKPQGSRFRFEIRPATQDSAAEQIWRAALRAFRAGLYDLT